MTKDLIKQFEENAIKQHEAFKNVGAWKANVYFKKIQKLVNQLTKNGEISKLEYLLTHEHLNVRYYAAMYLLPVKTKIAETVLEEIASYSGMELYPIHFNAEMTLKEWRKGNIKFDY